MEFFNEHAVGFAIFCALVAISFGLGLTWWLLQQPAGSERMREIARAVQEGAEADLRLQCAASGGGCAVVALLAAAAGFIGMNVAVRSNVRTAEAAKSGLNPALNVAFRAGSVTGLLVVGLGLLGVAGYYWILTDWFNHTPDWAIKDLVGLAFGGSLISVFARLGGGIYTKGGGVGGG